MSVGALAKFLKETGKNLTPSEIKNYLFSEVRRGALPKSSQDYYDTFDPKVYYHASTEDINEFNPQMDSSVGAYGDTLTRGATYFTSDRELADQVLQDKRILTQAEYLRQKLKMPSGQYPDFDVDTVYNPKTDQEYLSGSQIYPVKIKTDKLYDYTNKKHLAILEDAIEDELEFEKAIDFFEKTDIGSGDWRVLETPFVQTQLKKLGFSGYKTSEPGTVGLLNPDKGDVRSLYAKFDPKEAKSGEILASIVPYASVGTIGALAGLEDAT